MKNNWFVVNSSAVFGRKSLSTRETIARRRTISCDDVAWSEVPVAAAQ